MNKKIFLQFFYLFKLFKIIVSHPRFPSHLNVFHSLPLVMPTMQTLAVRRMVAGELHAILMQITLSPLSRVLLLLLHHMCTLCYFPCLLLFRTFLLFISSVEQRAFRARLCRLHVARFRHDARACAPVFYYREPPTFLLSVFLFFPVATPRLTTTLDRHVISSSFSHNHFLSAVFLYSFAFNRIVRITSFPFFF